MEGGEIATGFLNLFGNKGALGICLHVGEVNVLFVTAHLQAGEGDGEVGGRNAEFDYIDKNFREQMGNRLLN